MEDDFEFEFDFEDGIEPVWVDRGSGAGTLEKTDDWLKDKHSEYSYANDGRSHTRTTFYWRSGDRTPKKNRSRDRHQLHRDPEDRRSWSELANWNDGVGDPSRKQDNYDADVSRWVQTFCGQLNCNSYQEQRVGHIVESIDLDDFGQIPAEKVILGVISLVIDDDQNQDPEEWTPDDWIVYQDSFESLMDDLDMNRGTLWTVRKGVSQGYSFFD